jgi:hypothetical protein
MHHELDCVALDRLHVAPGYDTQPLCQRVLKAYQAGTCVMGRFRHSTAAASPEGVQGCPLHKNISQNLTLQAVTAVMQAFFTVAEYPYASMQRSASWGVCIAWL